MACCVLFMIRVIHELVDQSPVRTPMILPHTISAMTVQDVNSPDDF